MAGMIEIYDKIEQIIMRRLAGELTEDQVMAEIDAIVDGLDPAVRSMLVERGALRTGA